VASSEGSATYVQFVIPVCRTSGKTGNR